MTKSIKILLVAIFSITIVGVVVGIYSKSNIKYTVIFDSDGGTTVEKQEIKKGGIVKKPENPTKDDYDFVYWQYNNSEYNFDTKVENNIYLVAIWKPKSVFKDTVIVKFDTNGGNTISDMIIEKDTLLNLPDNPVKEGYLFTEWQLNGAKFDVSTTINENITLVANWEKIEVNKTTYTVSFNTNGGSSINKQIVEAGKQVRKVNNPNKSGYTFVEWQLDGKTYNFNNPVNSNIILNAIWKKNEEVKKFYTVTFKGDYISETNQTIESGKTISKPDDPKPMMAYRFIEWQLNGQTYNFSTPVNDNITLIAKYNLVYTANFNSNGGSVVPSQEFIYGNYLKEPAKPEKEGYIFVEWQLNGLTWKFDRDKPGGNITLVAVWEKKTPAVETVTVTFYSYGKVKRTVTLNKGEKIGAPLRLSNTSSHQFSGWVAWNGTIPDFDPSIPWCGMPYNFDNPINNDINLVACWVALNR